MKIGIRFTGIGGQGIVFVAGILAKAFFRAGKYAAQTQSYGSEMRGTGVSSEVFVSDNEILFPYANRYDILVALHQKSLERFKDLVAKNPIYIIDSGLTLNRKNTYKIPASKLAKERLGSEIFANLIILGYMIKKTGIINPEIVEEEIRESVPARFKNKNLLALRIGLEYE